MFPTCCVADFPPSRRARAPLRRDGGQSAGLANFAALADWKSAIRQTGSLRYGAPTARMRARCSAPGRRSVDMQKGFSKFECTDFVEYSALGPSFNFSDTAWRPHP